MDSLPGLSLSIVPLLHFQFKVVVVILPEMVASSTCICKAKPRGPLGSKCRHSMHVRTLASRTLIASTPTTHHLHHRVAFSAPSQYSQWSSKTWKTMRQRASAIIHIRLPATRMHPHPLVPTARASMTATCRGHCLSSAPSLAFPKMLYA